VNLKNYLTVDERQRGRFERLYARYRLLYEDPANAWPMFIVNTPVAEQPTWEERLADPLVMLRAELDNLRGHLEIEDDRVPTARVQFGTAQVAAAFGCKLTIPTNSLPAAASHPLASARDVYSMEMPKLEAGWYGKLAEWTEVYRDNLPEGVHIQHPDIQSPFNNAHLVRGNDILTDFFDDPDAVCALLDLIADYTIKLVPWLKKMISDDPDWFFDWGAMWKGVARISNCSMHMISPEFYRRFVLPRDIRLMRAIGGGRVHYCGTAGEVIRAFFENPEISGLDYDSQYHDLWELSAVAPERLTLLCPTPRDSATMHRLLAGDWPAKRNIILTTNADSVKDGRELLARLRRSRAGLS